MEITQAQGHLLYWENLFLSLFLFHMQDWFSGGFSLSSVILVCSSDVLAKYFFN